MDHNALFFLTGLLVVGVICQLVAWRLQLPAILFLLLTGFVVGPVTGFFDPDTMFGDLLFPMVSLGVAVILFEGALTLRFEEIKANVSVLTRLVTVGAIITMIVGCTAAYYLTNVNFNIALLFGAIITVTGPTVIMPLLRTVRPKADVANILRWEGIVIDPLGAIFAVLVFEYITASNNADIWFVLAKLCASGIFIGTICAAIVAFVLRYHIIPDFLIKIFILAIVVGSYALCDFIQVESGLLAVTIMGIVLANTKDLHLEEILDFKESLSILIISGLFIILSARMDMNAFMQAGWGALAVLGVVILVGRPLSIFISTFGSKLDWRQRTLLGWIAPRGIIAAAIAPLFTLKLESKGVEGAELLSPLVFTIIVGTVVIQSLTAGPIARFLGISEPVSSGVLVVSAGKLARAIAIALKDSGFSVMLADTNWDNVKEARMLGLQTFYGNVVSEHADRHMDLMGIGKLLAISKRPTVNALASMRYRREFGTKNVFIIKTEEERHTREKDHIAQEYTAPFLFGGSVTQAQLTGLLSSGYEIRSTPLTENFGYDSYIETHGDKAIPLFAITKKGQLVPYIENIIVNPEAGWTILSLLPRQERDKNASEKGSGNDNDALPSPA